MERNVYLKKTDRKNALKKLIKRFAGSFTDSELIDVPDANGRTLSKAVIAKMSSPNFHSSAMDGVAVRAEDTFSASERDPLKLQIDEKAFFINTGHLIPESCNAVVMIEDVIKDDDGNYFIEAPVFPWQNIRKMGEDIVATEQIFTKGHTITPYCIGALLSAGIFKVHVRKKPKVLVIPTGSEIFDWKDEKIENFVPGKVIESNSYVLCSMLEDAGAEYKRGELVRDDLELIKRSVADSDEFDMVLIIGGSSAGSFDFSKPVIDSLGEVFVHGVTIMPGKPVIMGDVKGKPVFGMPGYPVSTIIVFEQFVKPLIDELLARSTDDRPEVEIETVKKISSKLGVEEFLRVTLGKVGENIIATPLPRGSGNITTLTKADGVIKVPSDVDGINSGVKVKSELLKPYSSIRNRIVAVGSHDNTIDVLEDLLREEDSSLTVSSSHVGSMGGIIAVKNGTCHLAGSHLLDPSDGSYNVSYIKKHLEGIGIKLVNLVMRDQGFIIPKGNPKDIKDIMDLKRDDIVFMNRQAGSGTRILFDYSLEKNNIKKSEVKGYEDEEFTHMSVAVSVLSGRADVGLGIYAAAKALNLDFIPVITEQYDLIIREEFFESYKIQKLLSVINSDKFKTRVEALGGYGTEKTGKMMIN